jgi:hypothetical protein
VKTAIWRAFGPEYSDLFGEGKYGSGTYDHRKEVAVWEDAPLPGFDYSLNGGIGSIDIELPRRLGEIGEQGDAAEDADIGFGNIVEVTIMDEDSPDPVLVWRGRVESYASAVKPEAETVKVTLIPFAARLADAFFVGPKSFTDADPKDMVAWFLDGNYLPGFALDSASETVGATYTRTFEKQSLKQIFDDIRELAGAAWYYLLKPDMKVLFADYAATADHVLTIGKEVSEADFLKDTSRRRTRILVYGQGVQAEAKSPEYDENDPLDLVIVEDRITSQVVADQVAESILESRQGADLRVTCKVIDGNGPSGSMGPASPGTMADDASVGTVAWTSPDNAKASDDAYASAVLASLHVSHYLKATGFGLAVPSEATILGILAEVELKKSGIGAVVDSGVRIVKGGNIGSTEMASAVVWPTSDTYRFYGGATDLCGETWTPADINDPGFGIAISAMAFPGATAYIDHIRLFVFWTIATRGYDIESLRPGQTCRIVNPENVGQVPLFGQALYGGGGFYDGSAAEMSKQVLPIVKVQYGFDYADLELSTFQPDQTRDVQAILDDLQRHMTEAV